MTLEGGRIRAVDRTTVTLDVEEAIFSTPAMRRLKPDPVPDEVIWATIDAATRGPSSGNTRRWNWIVVRDETIKRVVGEWYREAWDQLKPGRRERLRRFATRVRGGESPIDTALIHDPNYRSGEYLAHNIAQAPAWVFAVLRGISGQPSLIDGADIFGAVQNLMLTARKYGVGSTLTMLHRQRERDVARILGLPSDARPIALIPLGYPSSGTFHTPRRPPVESVTHWDHWGTQRQRAAT
jgi:nitroreductase